MELKSPVPHMSIPPNPIVNLKHLILPIPESHSSFISKFHWILSCSQEFKIPRFKHEMRNWKQSLEGGKTVNLKHIHKKIHHKINHWIKLRKNDWFLRKAEKIKWKLTHESYISHSFYYQSKKRGKNKKDGTLSRVIVLGLPTSVKLLAF